MQHSSLSSLLASPPTVILLVGPTGVGKTDISYQLATLLNAEIINGDMGQLYTPLTIGTAKPSFLLRPGAPADRGYQPSPSKQGFGVTASVDTAGRQIAGQIPHHHFDVLSQPRDYSALQFRRDLIPLIASLEQRGKRALIVGGSLFYHRSLLFSLGSVNPTSRHYRLRSLPDQALSLKLWQELHQKDPARAEALHPHDQYRIERALELEKPSLNVPRFDPIHRSIAIIHLRRERSELYQRIDQRVLDMLNEGWFAEASQLSPDWSSWLMLKKMIGYDDLLAEIAQGRTSASPACIARIQQRTRNYAKRQLTFWSSFSRDVEQHLPGTTIDLNLTLCPFDLYLRA